MDWPTLVAPALAVLIGALTGWLGKAMLRRLQAIEVVTSAQLRVNGGGSLVDRAALIPEIRETIKENHEEAKGQWASLHAADGKVEERLNKVEAELRRVAAKVDGP